MRGIFQYTSHLSYCLYGIIIFIFRNPILKFVKEPGENDKKIMNILSTGYILIGLFSSIIYIHEMIVLSMVLGFPWVLKEYYNV